MKLEEAGVVWTYPNTCKPLDEVQIVFRCNALSGQDVRFEVTDAGHQKYLDRVVASGDGQAELVVMPGAQPGVHHIRVWTSLAGNSSYNRCGSFRVNVASGISCDNAMVDELFGFLEEGLRQTIDVANIEGKPVTYYKAADNSRENFAFPAFAVAALRYFIPDVKSMFEALYGQQWPDGRLPDHIYTDANPDWNGKRRIRTVMADLETQTAALFCKAWRAHGDDEWARELLPKVEAALEFVINEPTLCDEERALIKRPHTLDEWDIQFPSDGDDHSFINETSHFVLMQGDTSSMFEACRLLAELYTALGRDDRATYWRKRQKHYNKAGNDLFWDGVKYKHHIHLDSLDHGDFDEDDQLAMSNSWAVTRGFADHPKAVSILNEYMRRLETTGDRLPWWSLQPGYPDKLGYFKTEGAWSMKQGEYCNGGLFPWVGGEICRGAFQHGMEELAYSMLCEFHSVVKRDHGAVFTWYDLEGNPGINAPHHQTNYDPWGLTPWTQAVIEELAGIQSEGKRFERVVCCPRWSAARSKCATAVAHFPASNTYFAYKYEECGDRISVSFTGTGKQVAFRILIPGWGGRPKVALDGEAVASREEMVEESVYINVDAEIQGVRELTIVR
ncbi:MAG: hypothetical protein HN742_31615 [Lentisphaerae bacterium]|jgi:hypothetical protein|nr:hypothetical protein [Lentisphaerota bacterium]MBT4820398.1 hypothetical protein [Lentisphaerota bacterium]MBT5606461.1 hypothetical protein [Lentisphaerota bacterium]MBT7055677.1 hypothetical protein [Lentisphaerota bacterium]MBT7846460.1 hypothetical protein [Lentisphaerota bacterium]